METPLRGCSGGHIGTAPTVSFERIACGQLVTFGWITRGTVDVIWVDCVWTVGFVWVDCVWVVDFVGWENGAHEPTPSVLYFCQPRVADDRRLPWAIKSTSPTGLISPTSIYTRGFNDKCAPAVRHGRAHRHRPYQPPSYFSTQSHTNKITIYMQSTQTKP